MSDLKDFANQLQHDVVSDMAQSYFGVRKNLDEMIAAFDSLVVELRMMVPRLVQDAVRLHYLLLDRQTARDFYINLDIVPSCIPFVDESSVPSFTSLPFAFTERGRFQRCVCKAYQIFQNTADEYLNGVYYTEPGKGRKRLTVHYLRLKALAEHINYEIERVNTRHSPSGTLKYVKAMDPEQVRLENMLGEVCLLEGSTLDGDLAFTPIDFEGLGLPVVQDLPRLSEVKEDIGEFCKEIYPSRREDIARAMSSIRNGYKKD